MKEFSAAALPLIQEIKSLVGEYREKVQTLLKMVQMSGTPALKEVRKTAESMREKEVMIPRKELKLWREFNSFQDEDRIASFWAEFMKEEWHSASK